MKAIKMKAMMRVLVWIMCCITLSKNTWATGQVPDLLLIKGDTAFMYDIPLTAYIEYMHLQELPGFIGQGSTACYRGHRCIWEVKNDSLFLKAITSCHACEQCRDADLRLMFGSSPVFAHWVSEEINAGSGEMVSYFHGGFGFQMTYNHTLTMKNGRVLQHTKTLNTGAIEARDHDMENKRLIRAAYDTLEKVIYTMDTAVWSEKWCDESYYLYYTKKGRLQRVVYEPIMDRWIENKWYDWVEASCRRKLKRVLRKTNLHYLKPKQEFMVVVDILFYEGKLEVDPPMWLEFERIDGVEVK